MPVSLEQVQGFLDEFDLKYHVDEEREAILIGFGVDTEKTSYRNLDGEPGIQFVIQAPEDGKFLMIFAPQAWNVAECPHKAAVFEAIVTIQGQYKLMRFDYDPSDGEIRPNVELPAEDAEVTSNQFHRLLLGVYLGVQRYDCVVRHAMRTGEVSFAAVRHDDMSGQSSTANHRLEELAAEAGGIEVLERIACGTAGEGPVETRSAEEEGPPEAIPDSAADPGLRPGTKPVIRRIWDRFFGGDEAPGAGGGRKAG